MRIQFLNNPEFTVDANGILTRTSRWLLTVDDDQCRADAVGDFASEVESWVGAVNDPWRLPDPAGGGYTVNPAIRVTGIQVESPAADECEVTFTGMPADANSTSSTVTRVIGAYRYKVDSERKHTKTDQWIMAADDLESFLPAIGDPLVWAGETYQCSAVEVSENDNADFTVTLTATAGDTAGLDAVAYTEDTAYSRQRVGKWRVQNSELADFLAAHPVHGSAAAWSAPDYYVNSVKVARESAATSLVTLQAGVVTLQMLEAERISEFVGYIAADVPDYRHRWVSRWRVPAAETAAFDAALGGSAAAWAEEGYVVTAVTPRRVSAVEFAYTLEARNASELTVSTDSRRRNALKNLATRTEFRANVAEIRLSREQCGYRRDFNGEEIAIDNWQPAAHCPLATTTPLPPKFIDMPVKILAATIITYASGDSLSNAQQLMTWLQDSPITTGDIGTLTGSWLKVDCDTDDLTDHVGNPWTRITKTYHLAPAGYSWNYNFWN